MAYVAAHPLAFENTSVGSGQCVPLVQQATGAPLTRAWRPGPPVKGSTDLAPGTAIATFDVDGRYSNHVNHTSHDAIYLGQDAQGIQVLDQWVRPDHTKRLATRRTIYWQNSNPTTKHPVKSDNGDLFNVVE